MAPVRPFDSTRDMLISAIFGRDKAGQTVKDLVIGVERFFTEESGDSFFRWRSPEETSSGAR
jgi:hypothetical protein